ncbi:MAG: flagellar hook-associated protein FlgL [Halothiobacillaceae bacterium]
MRVSTNMMFTQGLNALQRQQTAISDAQKEISSGRKNMDPASDPVGYSTASNLEISNKRLAQYERNIDFARGKLELQEGVLANATDALQRVKEIGIEANNSLKQGDSANTPSRQALIDELTQLKDMILGQANTRDERGEYVFAGTAGNQAPYDPDGEFQLAAAGTMSVEVAEGRKVDVYRPADEVFNYGANADDSVITAVQDMIDSLGADPVDTATLNTAQQNVDQAFDRVVTARGQIGNSLSTLDRAFEDNDLQKLANDKALSDLRDTDYADAITRLNLSMTTMQATQQTISKTQSLSLFNFIG